MKKLQAVYYRDRDGRESVREFVETLDDAVQAAVENQVDRLNLLRDELPHLPFPHSSQVDGDCESFVATTAATSIGSCTGDPNG